MEPWILLVECHSTRLRQEGIVITQAIELGLKSEFPAFRVFRRNTDSESDFRTAIKEATNTSGPLQMVVIVGHSNVDGLEHDIDSVMNWADVGRALSFLAPSKVFAIGCRAGSLLALRPLFEALPSLGDVWAPPIKTDEDELRFIVDRIKKAILGIEISEEFPRILFQAIEFLDHGEVIRHWTRDEVLKATAGDMVSWTFWDAILEAWKDTS